MSVEHAAKVPRVPPRWFIRLAWSVHRGMYRVFGGRVGLWRPRARGWGALRLTTTGRRTGRQRSVIIGYFDDGPNLISLAMNGWGEGEPAWWLNLQTHPDATVDLVDGRRLVRGHAATGAERLRLWAPLARDRPEAGRLCGAAFGRDRGGGIGAQTGRVRHLAE